MKTILMTMLATLALLATSCDRAGDASKTAELCDAHGVADARCPFCHPELVESMGMCAGHGVAEAICFPCHPDLKPAFVATNDWCAEHERPESQCYICNPQLDPAEKHAFADLPPNQMAVVPLTAEEIAALPRSARPAAVACAKQDLRVRFANADIASAAGLAYAEAEERRITKTIGCNASLDYDRNRYAELSAPVEGVVEDVAVDLGDRVAAGQRLATVSSAALGDAKAALLTARAELSRWEQVHAREQHLIERGVSTEREALEATSSLAEARSAASRAAEELRRFGFSPQQIETIAETGDASPRFPLVAPFAGLIVERAASRGESAEPGAMLLAVADVSRVWALLDVWESDVPLVRTGQPVTLSLDAYPGETFGGRLSWVAAGVDPNSRTLAARAVLDNADGRLKARLFGKANIFVRESHRAIVVPQEAVQWEGCCNIVFVRRSDTLFEPRKVALGASTGAVYEVTGGLEKGEAVVTEGAFLLKTELLKGNIGAGCCEVAPGV